ncbi:MAG TPA: 2-C-methyl-D-erythritol 2,4-cyclodiphosphate synthase [Ignavibacteriaceae bacterium]|nr:2-C-methyl-D-erythritol 2,4-cyclodiphosphate synthase [Ignavibacteriaceae bacterium]
MKNNFRIGIGFDVHAFAEGRKLILGGIEIPFEKGLLGHSDADVLLHAISDALLGALSLGDIGQHFPDTDPEFKNADSAELLGKVYQLILDKGFYLGNLDSIVAMQKPKLAQHIPQIQKRISEILNTEIENISVKATTTEKLGFIGREEGVSAFATVLLIKK